MRLCITLLSYAIQYFFHPVMKEMRRSCVERLYSQSQKCETPIFNLRVKRGETKIQRIATSATTKVYRVRRLTKHVIPTDVRRDLHCDMITS